MVKLPDELKKLLDDKNVIKVLGTIDGKGYPHVVIKDSIKLLDDGNLAYAEELDSSIANKNMVRSIWFDKAVSVTVAKGEESFQIKGKVLKCLITGPLFKEFLVKERERLGPESDIQSVWIIFPQEVRNESRLVRRREEMEKHPYYNIHLDKLKAERK